MDRVLTTTNVTEDLSSKESWGRGGKELGWASATSQQETCVSKP